MISMYPCWTFYHSLTTNSKIKCFCCLENVQSRSQAYLHTYYAEPNERKQKTNETSIQISTHRNEWIWIYFFKKKTKKCSTCKLVKSYYVWPRYDWLLMLRTKTNHVNSKMLFVSLLDTCGFFSIFLMNKIEKCNLFLWVSKNAN